MSQEPLLPVCTVLCIEDDPDVFALIQMILSIGSPVRVLGCTRGEQALDFVRDYPPDLILLDLRLPDLPGEEVLRRLKAEELSRKIPVIVLSAAVGAPVSARLLELGATQCLQKPFGIAEFLEALEAMESCAVLAWDHGGSGAGIRSDQPLIPLWFSRRRQTPS